MVQDSKIPNTMEIFDFHEEVFARHGLGNSWMGSGLFGGLVDWGMGREPSDECFPAGTLITLADGSKQAIELITTSDKVLTFDDKGNRRVGEVVRTYTNTTPEFIRLSFDDGRDDLVATPGHAFLTETGDYLEIGNLARLGGGTVRLVDIDGMIITAKAERLVYSSDTAHLFATSVNCSMTIAGNLAFKEDVTEGWATHNFEVRTTHNYVAGNIRVHNKSGPIGQLGDSLDTGLDRLSGVKDGDGSFLDKSSDFINAGMHVVDRAMKNVSAGALHVGLVLLFFKFQTAYAEVERSSSPVIEPIERYILECRPKNYKYAEIFYSASRSDLYQINEHWGNTAFMVISFVGTENEGQYLKGYFFNRNRTRNPTGLPIPKGLQIPKDRIDEYRRDDGFREIWFVLSNQWLCSFNPGSQKWLHNMWEERENRRYEN